MRIVRSVPTALTVAVALVVALAGCGGGGGAGESTTSAGPSPSAEPAADCISPQQQAEHGLTVKGSEGGTVRGVTFGAGSTAIVYANMLEGDLCQWFLQAKAMAEKGYLTALFNYSGDNIAADVVAVADELRRRGARKVVLIGASKGGTAVLGAAAMTDTAAVVALSAPEGYYGVDALALMPKVTAPTLIAVGEVDSEFVDSARHLYAASHAAVKRLEVVGASGDHGVALLQGRVGRQLTAFVTTYAPASGSASASGTASASGSSAPSGSA